MATVSAYEHAPVNTFLQFDGSNDSEVNDFVSSATVFVARVVGSLVIDNVKNLVIQWVDCYLVPEGSWVHFVFGDEMKLVVDDDTSFRETHTIV